MTKQFDRLENGKLAAYAWPGGYPIYYLDSNSCVICPACANKEYEPTPASFGIVYDDDYPTCEDCGEEIGSPAKERNEEWEDDGSDR